MAVIPVAGVSLSQIQNTFGAPRSGGRQHHGIDIFARTGTPVLAAAPGTVVKAQPNEVGLGGRTVTVLGDDGRYYYYAHMDSVGIQAGARVNAGHQLGTVGNTGNARSTPPHLHFSIGGQRADDGAFNAFDFLRGAETAQGGVYGGGGAPVDHAAQEHQQRMMQFLDLLMQRQAGRGQPIPVQSAVQAHASDYDPSGFTSRIQQLRGKTQVQPSVTRRQPGQDMIQRRQSMLEGFERMTQPAPRRDEVPQFRQQRIGVR